MPRKIMVLELAPIPPMAKKLWRAAALKDGLELVNNKRKHLKKVMLARAYRFHGRKSLHQVYSHGKTVRSGDLSLKFAANNQPNSRAVVVITKKVTKLSPKRNRLRRRIYENLRQHWSMISPGHDLVITVFDERVLELSPEALNRTVTNLLTIAKLYK